MKCRDIMRRPVETLTPDATVQAAATKMKHSNIGLIAICNRHGAPIGVVTDRDLAVRVIALGLPFTTRCEAIMTRDPIRCGPDQDLEAVAREMAEFRKSRILVTENHRLVGIVSLSDLAAANLSIAAIVLNKVSVREVLDHSGTAPPHGP